MCVLNVGLDDEMTTRKCMPHLQSRQTNPEPQPPDIAPCPPDELNPVRIQTDIFAIFAAIRRTKHTVSALLACFRGSVRMPAGLSIGLQNGMRAIDFQKVGIFIHVPEYLFVCVAD